jgi:hypothetical protein
VAGHQAFDCLIGIEEPIAVEKKWRSSEDYERRNEE